MAAQEVPARPSLMMTRGRVDRVHVQVGFRVHPDGPAHEQFLLDLPTAEDGHPPDEHRYLAELEPVLDIGNGSPRHHSLHVHRWHTSWGVGAGALDIGLTVTTTVATAPYDAVVEAFRALLRLSDEPPRASVSRAEAVAAARRGVVAAYAVDADSLVLTSEEHHAARDAWTLGLRAGHEDRFVVVVGVVDGHAGSVHVRHQPAAEVADSLGTE